MKTSNYSDDKAREEIGRMLNLLVADEYLLYATTRDFQWNVTGPMSHQLQELFEWQAEHIAGWMDDVAGRMRIIGLGVRGNWADLAGTARATAEPGIGLPADLMLAQLIALHEVLMDQLRFDCETCRARFLDPHTVDVLTGILAQHVHAATKLRSLLETGAGETAWNQRSPSRDPVSAMNFSPLSVRST